MHHQHRPASLLRSRVHDPSAPPRLFMVELIVWLFLAAHAELFERHKQPADRRRLRASRRESSARVETSHAIEPSP